jgi:hypothetical protein
VSADDDFLAIDPLERDRWQRPLLVPRDGGEKVAYTRASTLAGYLSDSTSLHRWKLGLLAKGLADREDLAGMVAGLEPMTGVRKHDDPIKRKLSGIIDLALEVGGNHVKANYGTAVHSFCEPGNDQPVPERMKSDVDSFRRLKLNCEIAETFVANDEFMAAGSFDGRFRLPEVGLVIGDIKTGQIKPHDVAVQLAVYAGGEEYDPETNKRTPQPDDLNRDVGLLIHIPAGEGRTDLYLVDLVAGRQAAQVAAWVRDWRKRDDLLTSHSVVTHFVPPWLQVVS